MTWTTCFNGTYRSRRVLVTGHTGFKGSWLAIWLREMGATVCGYALDPPTAPSHFGLTGLHAKMNHQHGNLLDRQRLQAVVDACQPEIVFHLAAQPLVRRSYDHPIETFNTNVMGTANLLEAVRRSPGLRAVIVVTSDKCYRNDDTGRAFEEDAPLGGRDPYSASKACAELVAAAYAASYLNRSSPRRVGLATVRAGNVIGGGDWGADRIIPDCARAVAANRPVDIRFPDAERPWMHVLEALAGYLWLGRCLLTDPAGYGGSYNFGPPLESGEDRRVAAIVQTLKEYWPVLQIEPQTRPRDRSKPEASTLALNSARAQGALKWRTVWSLARSLEKTAAWYRAVLVGGPLSCQALYERTCADIAQYCRAGLEKQVPWALGRDGA